MNQIFGSLRPAILSLIFFFVVGLIVLAVRQRKEGNCRREEL